MATSRKREITINIVGHRLTDLADDAGVIKVQLGAAGYECAAQRIEYVTPLKRYSATQFYSRRVLP